MRVYVCVYIYIYLYMRHVVRTCAWAAHVSRELSLPSSAAPVLEFCVDVSAQLNLMVISRTNTRLFHLYSSDQNFWRPRTL